MRHALVTIDCEAICREQLTSLATPPPVSSLAPSDVKGPSTPSSSSVAAATATVLSSTSGSVSGMAYDMDPADIIKRRFAGLYKLLVPDAIAKEMKEIAAANTAAAIGMTGGTATNINGAMVSTSEWKDASQPLSSPASSSVAAARTMTSRSSLPTPSILLDTGPHINIFLYDNDMIRYHLSVTKAGLTLWL
jgi:hypothetical protein